MLVLLESKESVMEVPFLGVDTLTWYDGRRFKKNDKRSSLWRTGVGTMSSAIAAFEVTILKLLV